MIEKIPSDPVPQDPESFVALIMQQCQLESPSEVSFYNELLNHWREGLVTDDEVVRQAQSKFEGRKTSDQ